MGKVKIFLADDHEILREGLKLILAKVPRYEIIGESGDGKDALEIKDNGRGIEPTLPKDKKPGFGLENIKYRVEKMAGKFAIRGVQASGTLITIRIPIPLD